MFLDPEPRKPRHTTMTSLPSSPKLPSPRKSIESSPPRSTYPTTFKRKPLHERTKSQNNTRPSSTASIINTDQLSKSTVRLIQGTSSPYSSSRENSNPEDIRVAAAAGSRGIRRVNETQPQRTSPLKKPAGSSRTRQAVESAVKPVISVLDTTAASTVAPFRDAARPRIVEIPATSSPVDPPRAPWHRRSGSSGVTSDASTLYLHTAPDGSLGLSPRKSADEKRHSRGSLGTTLRGTPVPYDVDLDEEMDDVFAPTPPVPALETLPEASPERSTGQRSSGSNGSREQSSAESSEESTAAKRMRRSQKSASMGSLYTEGEFQRIGGLSARRTREDLRSMASSEVLRPTSDSSPNFVAYNTSSERSSGTSSSETSEAGPSSPNVIVYGSPSPRPKSAGRRLQGAPSFESIESRLQTPATGRSEPAVGVDRNSLASSQYSTLSDPPSQLYVPKKSGAQARMAALQDSIAEGTIDSEEIDTLPYPRQAFSMHLSTIASESDRSASRHWSQFSTGSGILTEAESSGVLPTRSWQSRLGEGTSRDWMTASNDQLSDCFSSDDEIADIAHGIFREESAKPLPLFKQQRRGGEGGGEPSAGPSRSKHYDGPMPPIPPIPWHAEGDEDFDQVADLYPSRLRSMRSAHSLRQRSNSTPSQSNSNSRHMSIVSSSQSSERPWSNGSGLFPYWAKQYYAHGAALMSASKISLSLPTPPRTAQQPPLALPQQQYQQQYLQQQQQLQPQQRHLRGDSEWTDITTTSRIPSSYIEYYETESPPSSHFLPSIFRPRTRTRGVVGGGLHPENSSRSLSYGRSQQLSSASSSFRGQPSSNQLDSQYHLRSRADSMAIAADPLPLPQDESYYTLEHPESSQHSSTIYAPGAAAAAAAGGRGSTVRAIGSPHQQHQQSRQLQHHPFPTAPSTQSLPASHEDDQEEPHTRSMRIIPHSLFSLSTVPHLHPTKRSAAQGLNPWRAPSFADSLDTLVRANGNRQIALFVLGFLCPLFWVLGAVLPVPGLKELGVDEEVEGGLEGVGNEKGVAPGFGRQPVSGPGTVGNDGRMSAVDSLYATSLENLRAATMSGGAGPGGLSHHHHPAIAPTRPTAGAGPHRPQSFESTTTTAAADIAAAATAHQRSADHEVALLMLLQHQAEQEAQQARWTAEKIVMKNRWWRTLNRIMSVVGVGIVAAIVALAVVAAAH